MIGKVWTGNKWIAKNQIVKEGKDQNGTNWIGKYLTEKDWSGNHWIK